MTTGISYCLKKPKTFMKASGMDSAEAPEEWMIWEVYEESGLAIPNPKLWGLLMFPKFKGND